MRAMIEIEQDQIDYLVINSLKRDYKAVALEDDPLRNAIDIVLEYYLDPNQWADWQKEKVQFNG